MGDATKDSTLDAVCGSLARQAECVRPLSDPINRLGCTVCRALGSPSLPPLD